MVTAYTASEESQRRRGEVSTQTVDGLSPWIKWARQDGEPEVVLDLQELTFLEFDRSPPRFDRSPQPSSRRGPRWDERTTKGGSVFGSPV